MISLSNFFFFLDKKNLSHNNSSASQSQHYKNPSNWSRELRKIQVATNIFICK